jgi:hypothetical protein
MRKRGKLLIFFSENFPDHGKLGLLALCLSSWIRIQEGDLNVDPCRGSAFVRGGQNITDSTDPDPEH